MATADDCDSLRSDSVRTFVRPFHLQARKNDIISDSTTKHIQNGKKEGPRGNDGRRELKSLHRRGLVAAVALAVAVAFVAYHSLTNMVAKSPF